MPWLYLMRHAQSIPNVERRISCRSYAGDLTPLGQQQAQQAAAWLRDKGITALRVSPYARTLQTAAAIAPAFGLTPLLDDDLREFDCGDLDQRTDDAAREQFHQIYERWLKADWQARFPGGEAYAEGCARFSRALHRAAEQGATTLLVTHGGIIRTIVPYLCVNAAALQRVSIPDNAAFVVLEPYDAERYICKAWNWRDHLADLA